MRDLARRVARRSYALTKWRLQRRMAKGTGTPVVIFCMSKTASSALVRAVRSTVAEPVFKIHMLAPDSIARAEANYREEFNDDWIGPSVVDDEVYLEAGFGR